MTPEPLVCPCCGRPLDGMPTDWAFQLPDEVWKLQSPHREERAHWTSDLCQLDERFFIRALLPLPFAGREGSFNWGLWVEVDALVFDRYMQVYSEDASLEPPHPAKIANQPPGYEQALGMTVQLKFGTAAERPRIVVPAGAQHTLARQQTEGLTPKAYHDVLERMGVAVH